MVILIGSTVSLYQSDHDGAPFRDQPGTCGNVAAGGSTVRSSVRPERPMRHGRISNAILGRAISHRRSREAKSMAAFQSTIDTSSLPRRAGSPITSISVILPFAIVKVSALDNRPRGAITRPIAPLTSAGCTTLAMWP